MLKHSHILLMALLLSPLAAEARVFSFKDRTVAGFVRGGGINSQLAQDAFANSSGVSTVFSNSDVAFNFFGEIGVQFSGGPLSVRLGIEALRPKELEIKGKNASDAELFTLHSAVFAYSPTLTIEYVYSAMESVRFYGYAAVGYSFVTLDNQYDMTSTGLTAFSPVTSHTEKGDGSGISGQLGLGFETMFVDNTTFSLDFGYRHLVVDNFKHKAANTTISQGAVAKGDSMLNHDGTARKLDLGGLTAGITFRFYIH
ncbi:MAG: outer membrane beta-barrel protein [Bdellovibrionales bacterium]